MKIVHSIFRLYKTHSQKVTQLFLIFVIFTMLLVYVPFLNIIITPFIGFVFVLIVWYFMFSPATKWIILIAVIVLLMSFLLTIFEFDVFTENLGAVLYFLFIFLFMNKARGRE